MRLLTRAGPIPTPSVAVLSVVFLGAIVIAFRSPVTRQAWLEAQLGKGENQQTVALPTSVVDIWALSRNLVLYVVPVIALIWALATTA